MKSFSFLFLISVLAASVALPQATNTPAPKTAPRTVTKAPPKAAPKAESKTATKAAGTTAGTAKKTATKKTYKSTKKTAPPAQTWRNRQLAPTPARYKEIQQALADKGYLKTEPNGVWDQQSEDALKQFQTDKNLPPTGKITSQSLIGLGLGPRPPEPAGAAPPPPDVSPPATIP